MASRPQHLDDHAEAFNRIIERLRRIDETLVSSALPPGYVYTTANGPLQIMRLSDGATSTVEFS